MPQTTQRAQLPRLFRRQFVFPAMLAAFVLLALFRPCTVPAQAFGALLLSEEEGLDNRSVIALAQQDDGHLWIATENGLYRYDGAHFKKFGRSDGFTETRFYNLYFDRHGTLWATTPSGIFYLDGERFHEVRRGSGIVFIGSNSRLTSTLGGEVIASDTRNMLLSLVRDTRSHAWAIHPFEEVHPGFPPRKTLGGILVDRASTLWLGSGTSIYAYPLSAADGHAGEILELTGVPSGYYDSFFQDRSGRLWARSLKHLVTWMPGESTVNDVTASVPPSIFATFSRRIAQDGFGNLLFTTGRGFATWDGHTWQETTKTSKGDIQGASDLLSDKEGNLWIGTPGRGLLESLGYRHWENFSASDGLSGADVFAIARDTSGRTWIGNSQGLNIMPKGSTKLENSALSNEKDATWIEDLAPDADGGMWAANLQGNLWHMDRHDRIDVRLTIRGEIQRIRMDPQGTLWIASGNGLYRIDCKGWKDCKPVPAGDRPLMADVLGDLVFEPNGTAWIAGNRGLYRMKDRSVQRIDVPGIANRFSLIVLGTDGTLWLAGHIPGTIRVRVDGDSARILESYTAPALASDYIEFLESDSRGRIWLGTDEGVNVIDGRTVERVTDDDGLLWNDTDWKASLPDADGSVWIGTSAGLSHLLHPDAVLTRGPFRGEIEDTLYDDTALHDGESLPWKNNGVLITHFSGLTFRDNRHLHYRYRLQGFDPNTIWTSIPFARFQQLPPGSYTLLVTAEDSGHHVLSSTASFSFTLAPPWWRTRVFYAFLVLCFLGLAVLIWHWSNLALIAQRERLKRLVAERTGELQRLAVTDSLTGLPNRGAIMTTLAREAAAAREENAPLCVAIVDLDHFKRINDTFGHQAGDEVLREAAQRLASGVRASDFVGRYGGEEFLIVFRNVQKELGRERCEAIRRAVCESPIRVQNRELSITTSIGVAWTHTRLCPEDALVALADHALYAAKANGRNRVEIAASEPETTLAELTSIR